MKGHHMTWRQTAAAVAVRLAHRPAPARDCRHLGDPVQERMATPADVEAATRPWLTKNRVAA
jgi:hypothetical protein